MAFELHRNTFPGIAASAVGAEIVVTLDVADVQRQVLPLATQLAAATSQPFGITLATAVTAGDAVTVLDRGNVVKVTAGASTGAGANVGIASSNGALGPVSASGFWAVGQAVTAAAAGERFSVYVNPRVLP